MRSRAWTAWAAATTMAGLALGAAPSATSAEPSRVEQVSVDDLGVEGDQPSSDGDVSADGRYVAFSSYASNLVPGDTNGAWDVFVRDRVSGTTRRISVSTDGAQADAFSVAPAISDDGRYVAFTSVASNLVPGDTNGQRDVFVHDMVAGTTRCVSVTRHGTPAPRGADGTAISGDGRYVGFTSSARFVRQDTGDQYDNDVYVRDLRTGGTRLVSVNRKGVTRPQGGGGPSFSRDGRYVSFASSDDLVAADTNHTRDVYVRDLVDHTTRRVSVTGSGAQGNHGSWPGSISANGRYVVFASFASNLVRHDTNNRWDVFVRDRVAGTTRRVSVSTGEAQANGHSQYAQISSNGRYVLFSSLASNLVPGDANNRGDVFLRDRRTGNTRLLSRAADGGPADESSTVVALSPDGSHLVFASSAGNLVPGDVNGVDDVFVLDR